MSNALDTPIARHIWDQRYRDPAHEASIEDTWRRIAGAVARAEPADRAGWRGRFAALLDDFRFLPGGRIQAGSGSGRRVSLFNCFVMGPIEDSIDGIFGALREGALTMQQGGGVGYDFSIVAPARHARAGQRRRRVRPGVVHGCVGRDVRHHPVHWRAPRRDDGDIAHRSSRYRYVHHRQAARRAAAPFQPLGAGQRRLHAGTRRGCRLAAGVSRRAGGAAGEGPAPVGPPAARQLRARRAWRAVHRPYQPAEQSLVPRAHHRDQPVRRGAVAAVRRLRSWLDQPDAADPRPVHARMRGWIRTGCWRSFPTRCGCWTT